MLPEPLTTPGSNSAQQGPTVLPEPFTTLSSDSTSPTYMLQVTKQTTPRLEDLAWRRFPEMPITTVTVIDTPGGLEPSITYDMRECKQQTGFQGPYFWDDFDKQMLQEYEEAYAEQQQANVAQPPLANVAQPLLE